jgi:CBS domain-containing protein
LSCPGVAYGWWRTVTLADLMRRDVVTAAPAADVETLARKMHDADVGCVVIVDDSWPVGLVTDRDLTIRVLGRGLDPTDMTAHDVMTGEPITAPIGAGLLELTATMRDEGVRRMPVVDGDELAGIVTMDDLYRLLVDELDNLSEVVAKESPPY